ncbi:hypothetical protein B0T19DRAFT_382267 [Cercophora scortea]|uniref:J domain-containing protein n=1 Tax=Cercophora scortea TaxID=314031 RepID=A0AAE0IYB9_9PEZI|nr:hypothetical protein B0T19DRAFT_382267 [Cercophora scortea]
MASPEELIDGEPPIIDPYEVLGIAREASADQIKTAYRKAALRNHPDKVSEDKRHEAKENFQSIAFAYAVLSDPARRKRYNETGSTSESIVDSEGFSWTDFYQEQYRDVVTSDAIEKFAAKYKGSDEEKDDILVAYEEFEGDMDKIYETVMLSDVLEDDERFRKIISDAIAAGDVPAFSTFTKETKRSKQARIKAARGEQNEAEQLAKELGVHDKLGGKKTKKESEDSLAALILQNQSSRASAFDKLVEKYSAPPKSKPGKKRAAKKTEEPDISEEQFQALQADILKNKTTKKKRAAKDLEEPDISEEQFQALQAEMLKNKAKKRRAA